MRFLRRLLGVAVPSLLATFFIIQPAFAATDIDSSRYIVRPSMNAEPRAQSGAFEQQYSFTIPPGRNGMQPSMQLQYSSGANDNASEFGYGWSLDIPSIRRIPKHGTDDLYTRHDFSSSLSGELSAITLSDATHGTFGAMIDDGSQLDYTYSTAETWTAVDKNGTTYTFGGSSSARVVDPSNSSHVYEWMLTSIQDLLGNTVTYTYTTDGAQVYPSTINYTGFGGASGIFTISFALETRSDALTSYASGFAITTSYRVNTVSIAVNTQTVRSYALTYGSGDDGIRSLLTSITETATTDDGATSLSKPATTFTYADGNNAWASSSISFPETIAGDSAGSLGVYLFDMNGDAIPDIVRSRDTNRAIYTGNGDGTWAASTVTPPIAFSSSIGKDMGVRVMDFNGDGALDLVYARTLSTGTLDQAVYINNNDGTGWTLSTTALVPVGFTTDGGLYIGVETFDVDGDGLPDIVKSRDGQTQEVYINNGDGTGWTLASGYVIPVYFASTSPSDMGVRFMDVNGDHLTDLVYSRYLSSTLYQAVYLNNGNGTGWTQDTSWTVPEGFLSTTTDYGVRPMDVNGDGLVDLVYHRSTGSVEPQAVYINTGKSWVEDSSITTPLYFTYNGLDIGVRVDDFDADGLPDLLKSRNISGTTTNELYLASGVAADLMTSVTTSLGGSSTVTYSTSANGSNTALPFVMQVTSSVVTNDGLGNAATKTYSYAGGDYYGSYFEKKFAGFGTVTATDSEGSTKRYFHQGNATNSTQGESTDSEAKIGRQYREERVDTSGHIYRTSIDTWGSTNLGTNRDFIYRSQNLELLYGSGSTHKDKAVAYTYDSAGNMTQQLEYGDGTGTDSGGFTDTGSDKRTTNWTYATSSALGETAHRSSEKLLNSSNAQIQYTKWYYDSLAYGSVSNGLMSKQTNYTTTSVSYSTTYTYNSYGNLLTVVDPGSNTTTYTPDSVYLYPATVTDALSHATTYTYDYSSGQVKTTVDPNGKTSTTTYDAFDRPTAIAAPSGSSTVTVSEYVYTDSAAPMSVHTTDWFDASTARETYTYFDGFGRQIQNRVEAEGMSTYNVTDTVYDSLGRVSSVSLPYSQSGSSRTSATTTTALLATTSYDVLDRPTSVVDATGTTSTSYSGRVETVTDVNSNVTVNTMDAFGRIASVGEKIGTSTYTTTYTYDAANRLTQSADPKNYYRAITYDNRGARLTAKDLRASSDTAYGTWTYTYNGTGTMATAVSPASVTTTYAYDALGRETSEDASSTTGTDIAYTYDSCTNGVGHICTATVLNGASTSYTYDDRGRIASQVRTIGSTAYTTSYTYDRQGNIATVTYPDSSTATNSLDTDGTLNSVVFVDGHGSASTTVVSDIVYGTHGKPTSVTFGNGAVTTYTYDATKRYRLSTLNTVKGSTTLENFAYTYDNLGNITNLADTSSLYTSMATAYTYDARSMLTAATATSTNSALTYAKTWTYNTNGTLKTSTDCGTYTYGGSTAGNYANMHAPTSVCSKTLTYDISGHLTGDGTWTHTWNGVGLLSQSAKTGVTVTYQYDENGNRVQQVSSVSGTTNSPNDYYTVDGTTYERNIIAGSLGNIATSTYNGTTSSMIYHHHDHLGGTHVETDSTGTAVEYTLYTPFGGTLLDTKTGTYENDHKFTNKELDTDTGLYYYGARYYNPTMGVFIAQDPLFVGLGSQGVNDVQKLIRDPHRLDSYSYSRNNPINLYDPDGRSWFSTFSSITNVANTIGSIVSLGGWSIATSMAESSGHKMANEGVSVSTVANIAGSAITGAAASATGAFVTGWELGTAAVSMGLVKLNDAVTKTTPDFIVTPGGTAYPVPTGATGPTPVINGARNQTGSAFTGGAGGANGQVSSVRIMNPNSSNPSGYIKYENSAMPRPQGVDPYSGQTVSPVEAHHPIDY